MEFVHSALVDIMCSIGSLWRIGKGALRAVVAPNPASCQALVDQAPDNVAQSRGSGDDAGLASADGRLGGPGICQVPP